MELTALDDDTSAGGSGIRQPCPFRVLISALRFCPCLRITGRMLAKVCSAAVNGIEAYPVEVEVNAGYGDTIIVIVVNKTPKRCLGLLSLAFC
jgi:hypothetical protein